MIKLNCVSIFLFLYHDLTKNNGFVLKFKFNIASPSEVYRQQQHKK